METNSTQPKAEMHATIGVNAQVAIGVAVACVWMIGVNRKLRTVNQNVITLGQALSFTNDGLAQMHQDSITVKDVIRLAAATEPKGA